jgi:hypothetical protein
MSDTTCPPESGSTTCPPESKPPWGISSFFRTAYDVTRLFDNCQAQVPGVTTDMVSLAIWAAIEDFYIRSAYRREHVYWQLNPGECRLDFDAYDDNWRVCWFLAFNGLSNPKFVPPGQVIDLTCPTPDSVRNGEALLALKPDNIDVELPYDVWTTYWETLFNGAMHRLYMQPGKPYSDIQAALTFGKMYRSGIATARADAQARHLGEGSNWRFPYYANGGRRGR